MLCKSHIHKKIYSRFAISSKDQPTAVKYLLVLTKSFRNNKHTNGDGKILLFYNLHPWGFVFCGLSLVVRVLTDPLLVAYRFIWFSAFRHFVLSSVVFLICLCSWNEGKLSRWDFFVSRPPCVFFLVLVSFSSANPWGDKSRPPGRAQTYLIWCRGSEYIWFSWVQICIFMQCLLVGWAARLLLETTRNFASYTLRRNFMAGRI